MNTIDFENRNYIPIRLPFPRNMRTWKVFASTDAKKEYDRLNRELENVESYSNDPDSVIERCFELSKAIEKTYTIKIDGEPRSGY